MIGNYPFKNYEEFKELFVREDGRRKNAVLLAWYRSKEMRTWLLNRMQREESRRNYSSMRFYAKGFTIRDMSALKEFCLELTRTLDDSIDNVAYRIHIPNWGWYPSNLYCTDSRDGLCYDRDYRAYRYRRVDNDRDFKMKMGRLFAHVIECSFVREALPNPVKLWLCEEVQRDWEQYTRMQMPPQDGLKLTVSDEFGKIYSSSYLKGDFGSCMTNRDLHYFYENAVKARAAYLSNEDNEIVARCVIFDECEDIETGEVVRLAERQYASNGYEVLKQDLISALIRDGHIDGYKRIGAGCGESNQFVSNTGESWSGRHFRIKCNLDFGDDLSYQDSFKFYDMGANFAYNWCNDCPTYDDYRLDITEGNLRGGNYDEYNDEYTSDEVVQVYAGRWMTCNENYLDDFYYVEGEGYVHYDYCTYCEVCDTYFMDGQGYESEITGNTYCCESCLEDAEREYKEENWTYSEYDDEYFEDEDDVTTIKQGNCDEMTISVDSANRLVTRGEAILLDGKYYDKDWAISALENA